MINRKRVYQITINGETHLISGVANFFEAFQSLNIDIDEVLTLIVQAKRVPTAKNWRTMGEEWMQKAITVLKNPDSYLSPEQRKAARIKKEKEDWAAQIKKEERDLQKEQQRQRDLNNPNLYKTITCKRCKGKGYLSHYAYNQCGKCFGCYGAGIKKVKIH